MRRGIMALFLLCSLTFYNSFGQDPADPGDPCFDPDLPGCGGSDEGVPLDGGIGILLAAGAAYGLKKLNEKRNNKFIENK